VKYLACWLPLSTAEFSTVPTVHSLSVTCMYMKHMKMAIKKNENCKECIWYTPNRNTSFHFCLITGDISTSGLCPVGPVTSESSCKLGILSNLGWPNYFKLAFALHNLEKLWYYKIFTEKPDNLQTKQSTNYLTAWSRVYQKLMVT